MLTGALGIAINVAVAVFLTEYIGLNYLVSLTICSALVIVIGFLLNRSWTFRKHGSSVGREFLRYALVTGINVPFGLVCCAVLVKLAGIPYGYSVAIVGIAFAPLTYAVHRLWTFGLGWRRSRQ